MSAQRQQRKHRQGALARAVSGFWARTGLVCLLLAGAAYPPGARAATTERIVTDPNRGLALNGFDPVAYFTDGKPLQGRDDLELRFAGVTWRFRNEGNLAAFVANPEVYLPMFGGHDPMAAARGVATPGHPQIWLITGERLYLFYDGNARKTFAADPVSATAHAEKKWPDVLRTIVP